MRRALLVPSSTSAAGHLLSQIGRSASQPVHVLNFHWGDCSDVFCSPQSWGNYNPFDLCGPLCTCHPLRSTRSTSGQIDSLRAFTRTLVSLFTGRLCHSAAHFLVWILVILYSASASWLHPERIQSTRTRNLPRADQIHNRWERSGDSLTFATALK